MNCKNRFFWKTALTNLQIFSNGNNSVVATAKIRVIRVIRVPYIAAITPRPFV